MGVADIKAQIVSIASDLCLHKFFPLAPKNRNARRKGTPRAFRAPDDGTPFGFEFHGASIEVHVQMVARWAISLKMWRMEPRLLILGIRRDGLVKVIAKNVNPNERAF